MDADFRQLSQYGAVGIVAGGLLILVVMLFRQFVMHALEQNKNLQKQNHEMQEKMLAAINLLTTAVNVNLVNAVKDMHASVVRDVGQVFNEVSAITETSRPIRSRPPR